MLDPRPLIITALLEPAVQARFETLRRAHYPAARNQVPAHVTLFRQLPGRELDAVKRRLKTICAEAPPPPVTVTEIERREGSVAFRLRAPALADVQAELAAGWAGLLTPQDRAGFAGHVTVQNKVAPALAKVVLGALSRDFVPREVEIAGLASWWYRGGPWEANSRHMFA